MIYSFVFQDSEHIAKEEMTNSLKVKSPPSLRDLVRKVKFGIWSNICKLLFLHCLKANEEFIRTKLLEVIAFMSRSSMYLAQQTNVSVRKLLTKKIMNFISLLYKKTHSGQGGRALSWQMSVQPAVVESWPPRFIQTNLSSVKETSYNLKIHLTYVSQRLKAFMGLVRALFWPLFCLVSPWWGAVYLKLFHTILQGDINCSILSSGMGGNGEFDRKYERKFDDLKGNHSLWSHGWEEGP